MRIEELNPFGVEVFDLDVGSASETQLDLLDALFREHSFVVFRNIGATPDEHVRLVERHGDAKIGYDGSKYHHLEHDGGDHVALVMAGEISFHADETFLDDPIRIISLAAEIVPPSGGETVYAHGGFAYDQLAASTRARIADLTAVHAYDATVPIYKGRFTEDILGDQPLRSEKPIVREQPYTGAPVLSVTYQHDDHIPGLPADESDALLAELFDALYDPAHLYRHAWQVGDVLLWDNRVMQHARRPFDPRAPRKMRRVTISSPQSDWFEQRYGGYITSATSELETKPLGRFSGSAAPA